MRLVFNLVSRMLRCIAVIIQLLYWPAKKTKDSTTVTIVLCTVACANDMLIPEPRAVVVECRDLAARSARLFGRGASKKGKGGYRFLNAEEQEYSKRRNRSRRLIV